MLRPILVATGIAGTLDIIAACIFAGIKGVGPMGVLQFVASGPFGDAAGRNPTFAPVGLGVHYAIMACMVATYMFAATRIPLLTRQPIAMGAVYGIGLWMVMNLVVLPLRWPDRYPPTTAYGIITQLFCHTVLVGIPIALIVARHLRTPQATLSAA
ncbi:MAG: hypothetical protein ACREB5_02810 [Sphingomonadaceae bacterium]